MQIPNKRQYIKPTIAAAFLALLLITALFWGVDAVQSADNGNQTAPPVAQQSAEMAAMADIPEALPEKNTSQQASNHNNMDENITAILADIGAQSDDFLFDGVPQEGAVIRAVAPAHTVKVTLDGKAVDMDADGHFVFGFNRDSAGSAIVSAQLADGRIVSQTLQIAPRKWDLQYVNVAKRPGGGTSEAYWQRRKPEWEQIVAAREMRTGAIGWRQDFIWPVFGRISGMFGNQRVYKGGETASFHSGIDIAAPKGKPIYAPADGVVILATEEPFSLEGMLLMLDHGMELNSAFLHLSSIAVKNGDHVKQGQMIATVGSSGRATGAHLHWSMKWRDARVDPILLTWPMPDM